MDNNISIKTNEKLSIDYVTLQKMAFLYNTLENGWTIKKNENKYIFTKKHEGEKEIMLDSYLRRFVEEHFDINKLETNSNMN